MRRLARRVVDLARLIQVAERDREIVERFRHPPPIAESLVRQQRGSIQAERHLGPAAQVHHGCEVVGRPRRERGLLEPQCQGERLREARFGFRELATLERDSTEQVHRARATILIPPGPEQLERVRRADLPGLELAPARGRDGVLKELSRRLHTA